MSLHDKWALSAARYAEAKAIYARLRMRAEEHFTFAQFHEILFAWQDEGDLWLSSKEQHMLICEAYMREVGEDDDDVRAYRRLYTEQEAETAHARAEAAKAEAARRATADAARRHARNVKRRERRKAQRRRAWLERGPPVPRTHAVLAAHATE
jgi:hypothetical protein